ncbi:hypothetical protein D9611_014893 [Ephemerocybe angulata]|uniref:Uncharacterized protein n=1 Tax=Ephemerocybe angulata TaxID=980116 RepID=A0A8H5F000_9AGAR|nr:hypothetical protein D9611_014893 [Tulosesus angulatus]
MPVIRVQVGCAIVDWLVPSLRRKQTIGQEDMERDITGAPSAHSSVPPPWPWLEYEVQQPSSSQNYASLCLVNSSASSCQRYSNRAPSRSAGLAASDSPYYHVRRSPVIRLGRCFRVPTVVLTLRTLN